MWSFQRVLLALIVCLRAAAAAPPWDGIEQSVIGGQESLSSIASSIRKALQKAEVIPDGKLQRPLTARDVPLIHLLIPRNPAVLDDDFQPLFSLNISYPDSKTWVDLGNTIKPKAVSSSPDLIIHALDDESDSIPTPTISSNITYTFVLSDPDATSRSEPVKAEMCHWIVTGITLDASSVDHVVPLPIDIEDIVAASQLHGRESRVIGHGSSILEESCAHPCGYHGQICCHESETCAVSGVIASCVASHSKPKELMSYFPPAPPPKTGYHRYVFVLLAPNSDNEDGRHDSGPKKPKERPHWGYGKVGKGVRKWAKDNGLIPVGANFFYARNKEQ
ncbi:MAG: hypothetical protein LQ338_000926 [Usnochroma carphineum]|nr:MAG: hypothetical protein LQ338_000926 [Usnochroma carphineum]